jgi:hypothetical protein
MARRHIFSRRVVGNSKSRGGVTPALQSVAFHQEDSFRRTDGSYCILNISRPYEKSRTPWLQDFAVDGWAPGSPLAINALTHGSFPFKSSCHGPSATIFPSFRIKKRSEKLVPTNTLIVATSMVICDSPTISFIRWIMCMVVTGSRPAAGSSKKQSRG